MSAYRGRTESDGPPAQQQDRAGTARPGTYALLGLQAAAGNRAVGAFVQRLSAGSGPVVARDDDAQTESSTDSGTGAPLQAPGPAAPASAFTDAISDNRPDVGVAVRANAREFNDAVHAKFGGDGGRTTVSNLNLAYDLDANGKVSGARSTAAVQASAPSVAADPNGAISQPNAAAELAACQALAAQIRSHENKHADIEVASRTGLAASIRGKSADVADKAQDKLQLAIGRKQRALDNQEGSITLGSNNQIVLSGVDHPEYEQLP